MIQKVIGLGAACAALVAGTVGGIPTADALTQTPPSQPVAGYLASEGGLGEVAARFTIPTVTCAAGAPDSGVVLGVELLGSHPTVGGYEVGCSAGAPVYAGTWSLYGSPPVAIPGPVKPGDVISVWVKAAIWAKDGRPFVNVNVADLTEGGGVSSGEGNISGSFTEAAVGAIGLNCGADGCAPVPQFTGVGFGAAINNGSLAGATRSALTAVNGTVEAGAGALDAATHRHFRVSWKSTCAADTNDRC